MMAGAVTTPIMGTPSSIRAMLTVNSLLRQEFFGPVDGIHQARMCGQ